MIRSISLQLTNRGLFLLDLNQLALAASSSTGTSSAIQPESQHTFSTVSECETNMGEARVTTSSMHHEPKEAQESPNGSSHIMTPEFTATMKHAIPMPRFCTIHTTISDDHTSGTFSTESPSHQPVRAGNDDVNVNPIANIVDQDCNVLTSSAISRRTSRTTNFRS